MLQILIRQGRPVVEDVPAPLLEPGTVLVRASFSTISSGTELAAVRHSAEPLWRRALSDPAKIGKALRMVASRGLAHTREAIEGRLGAGDPVGYSASGAVLAVGQGVGEEPQGFRPGDRVACAGTGYANHAELLLVPLNLAVAVPAGVDQRAAATVALGAIALQGVRRFDPTLGETVVVLGLGLLGQLTAQILRANGCRVIGIDLDRGRIELARSLGMELGAHPDDGDVEAAVGRLTGGAGADGVLITAASPSDEPVSLALRVTRRRGRVVLVGDVGLGLKRADLYRKELDFLVATSYGPGRYDRHYEEEGLDYPLAYVRWTERRNMAAYLDLLAAGSVRVDPLVAGVFPAKEAAAAYDALRGVPAKPLVLLSYPEGDNSGRESRRVANPLALPGRPGAVRLGLVGAGSFARGTHLPNLRRLSDLFTLEGVASRSGANALAVARQFNAPFAATDPAEIFGDPAVDAVLIATRHDRHAALALAALEAGKHVLVEKPLALTRGELETIQGFYDSRPEAGAPILLTGFNRRFSPYLAALRELLGKRREPFQALYRMNAGYLPPDHWVHGPEGGGRNLGEACHVYDLFTFLADARVVNVAASAVRSSSGLYRPDDNFSVVLTFDDGSVCTLLYTAMGHAGSGKERLELFAGGMSATLDDYRRLTVHGHRRPALETPLTEKGHLEELRAFAAGITGGGPWPIPLWQQVQATEIALRVEELLSAGG